MDGAAAIVFLIIASAIPPMTLWAFGYALFPHSRLRRLVLVLIALMSVFLVFPAFFLTYVLFVLPAFGLLIVLVLEVVLASERRNQE